MVMRGVSVSLVDCTGFKRVGIAFGAIDACRSMTITALCSGSALEGGIFGFFMRLSSFPLLKCPR